MRMQLHVIQDQHFTCASCTKCCRDWHVHLDDNEVQRIRDLSWPAGDPLSNARVIEKVKGNFVIKLQPDGACVFLNPSNGYCRIHEQFDYETKPLGCRLFPFQISPTFAGEATVTGRFDCPTIRKNEGQDFEASIPDLQNMAGEMHLGVGIDDDAMLSLSREQIELLVEFLVMLLGSFERDQERSLFLLLFADWLETQMPADISREMLGESFPQLKTATQRVLAAVAGQRPARAHRMAFRALLAAHLRRDEDVMLGRAGRLGRLLANTAVTFGFGRLDRLGLDHRPARLRPAKILYEPHQLTNSQTTALIWRLIKQKLLSLQFMGPANFDLDLTDGLRTLALLYPLIMAVAKTSCVHKGAQQIDTDDIDFAVAAIEHGFGRSPLLALPATRRAQGHLLDLEVFTTLVTWV